MWFFNIIYWIQVFVAPLLLSVMIELAVRHRISILVVIVGAVLGIVLAEYIRRKIGFSRFFGNRYGPKEKENV